MKKTKADNYIEATLSGWYTVHYLDSELQSYQRKFFDTREDARMFVIENNYFNK